MFGKRKHERASGSAHERERERTERKIAEEAARSCKEKEREKRENKSICKGKLVHNFSF